ncbi:Fusaric acid resistance protein-like [Bradyrhizobium erythrophlei]|uniref:Fusaric acid resistance protein-like n=1 Tax=Bradyrhizobium erythrophlei TaxID=1437360 RepID=A0A1M5GWV8_9BRAD|nr:FUSC family protein [Bradyrhizobium erythrophlei]SHG08209.1 Fusaric acid resistance protein-like [Bradyrhizobium erythrophlei]
MNSVATLGRWLRGWPWSHRTELRLCLRVSASAVLTLVVSQLFHLRFALWAVLTAVVLTQMSVGRSLKATADYLAGTLGGALFAGVVGALIPHDGEIGLGVVLAVTLVPVALVAAENPRFSAGPFTAVLVVLAPTVTHLGPIASAFERVVEVGVGCVVGLVVSFAVLPARAYDLAIDAGGRMLALMAHLLPHLFKGLSRSLDRAAILRIQEKIGGAYAGLDAIAAEGTHERMTYLTAERDLAPLVRTLLRLRHDFVMIGRAASVQLPAELQLQLGPLLTRICDAAVDYLRASSVALVGRQRMASDPILDAAFDEYAAEMGILRHQNPVRDLPVDVVERIFTLAFALEQLRRNFNDLERCIADHSERRRSRRLIAA